MAKQLNVNLAFTANTQQAKAQLKSLQGDLEKLTSMSSIGVFNNADMEKAITAAKSLQTHLNNAVNVNTGRLDLSRFSKSLQRANQSLGDLRKDLSLAGEMGDQAFLQLARSISQAEAPAIRINNTLREMGNTLKNTVRWQLSSSVLHGFMGAVQSAYGYAQDLDQSLNNIRIVTGQNKEQMAEFAKEANKAAKALSTTTTAYTNAALIYYQQGDNDQTVLEKTDVTAKMANVTGTSAEVVSDQLTAIWNNFNKSGEESYEKYADILTALGAATASSTDEIAGGLEKFASIADMIGLSYEYAASALATITATTRQSEEVVGTALKTIFARIQGLSLGETLDDGTDLNKYSDALMKVGISIKDQNGQLKDMDDVLNEMGAKWQTLSKDQQVALAQTVAGVRQYNQLVSLMDNWDFMKQNLATAEGAEGTLDAQAAIYAESWEAAAKRVKAATEDVFDSLIDDDFFISMTNGMAGFVDGIGTVVDALGGMQGIVTLVGSIFLKNFAKEIPDAIASLTENFNVLTGKAQDEAIKMMQENQKALEGFTSDKMTNALDAELTSLTKVNDMKRVLAQTSHTLTEAERQQFEQEIQMVEAAGQLVAKEGEKIDAIEKEIAANERRLVANSARSGQSLDGTGPRVSNLNGDKEKSDKIKERLSELKKLTQEYVSCEQVLKRLDTANATWLSSGKVSAKSMIKNMTVFKQSFIEAKGGVSELTDAEKKMCDTLEAEIKAANGDVEKLKKAFNDFGDGVKQSLNPVQFNLMDKSIADLEQSLRDLGVDNEALNNLEQQFKDGALSADEYRQKLLALQNTESQSVVHATKMSETIGFIGGQMMQVAMAANTLKQAWNIWSDEDATLGEKILTTMTALGTVIPIVTAVTNADNASQMINHGINLANLAVKSKIPGISKLAAAAEVALTAAKTGETGAVVANTAAWASNPIGWIALAIMGVVGALVVLVAALKQVTTLLIKGAKIETENCEQLIENAEKTKELANANEELSDSMDTLISNYEEMNAAGEDTSAMLSEIADKMPDLIQSYKDFAEVVNNPKLSEGIDELQRLANIAELTNDYSAFTDQKAIVDDMVAIETATAAKSGASNASTQLAAKMRDSGAKRSGSGLNFHVGGAEGGGAARDEKDAINLLKREMGDYVTANAAGTGADLRVANYADPLELVDYYEKMVKARDAMLKEMSQEQLKESDTFREINEMIAATTSEYQVAKEQADEYIQVAGTAVQAQLNQNNVSMNGVDTMEEYLAYKQEFLKVAQQEYDMSEEQALSYLKQASALGEMNDKYDMASMAAEKFMGVEDFDALSSDLKTKYLTVFEDMTKDLEAEDFALAIEVMADADSIEEFEHEMMLLQAKRETVKYDDMASSLSTMMTESQKEGSFSASQMTSLSSNEQFQSFLGDNGISSADKFAAMNYSEQYALVAEFYADVQALRHESLQYQKELYYEDLKTQQETLDKMYSMTEEQEQQSLDLKAQYAEKKAELDKEGLSEKDREKIEEELATMSENYENTFGFSIELDSSDIKNKMQQIQDQIANFDQQQIDLAIEWDGIDEIEGAFKQIGSFASMMQNDAKKVGNSYQLTAAQAREWMEVYPDLFSQAEKTSDGLISLDQSVVDNYISGQDAEVDATVDAKIKALEAERSAMEAKLEMAKADLDAAAANAEGKMALEGTSAEYLAEMRKGLTQYYMDLGLDEVEADAAALTSMGLNQEEYTDLVAAAAEKNAENQIDSSEEGGKAQANILTQLAEKWKKFTTVLKRVGEAVKAALNGEDVKEAWGSVDASISTDSASFSGADLSGYTFDATNKTEIDAVRQIVNGNLTAELEAKKAEIEKALGSIDSQITYLEALKNQDLSDYGSTDPNKDSGGNKKELKELLEISERYHEINEEIKTQEHLLNKLSKAKDRAYGADKIALMDEEIKTLKKLEKKNQDLHKAQTLFLAIDKAKVQSAFENAKFDEDGNISNYSQLLQEAADKLNSVIAQFNNVKTEAAEKAVSEAEKEYDNTLKLLEKYEDTLSALRDQEQKLIDIRYQIQDANYEKLQEALNLKIEIDEDSLRRLELTLKQYGDNFFKMAEAAAILGKDKVSNATSQLSTYKGHKGALDAAYAAGEISQADYMAGVKEVRDGIYAQLEALIDLDNQMMHYYEDTLSAASEELADYTDHMEHLTSVFDHYLGLMDLLGKKKDYDAIGNFLGGKAETLRDRLDVSKEYYNMLLEQKATAEQKLNAAIAAGDDAAAELYRNEWDAIVDAVDEAQEEMLSLTEEWAEAMKAVIENNMNQIADTLEKSLTGGFGFDRLMENFDMLNTQQEEFLTKTNQIYETNKLMRTANKALDETDNKVAKQKIKNFIEETKSLQENTKLSQYELDIQQAKYDLLLAEIALEEAKNAKSTVRLSRDSEGNFGYVYTTDQDAIDEAQQGVDDAQNKLYNMSLDGQQNYTQKYLQAQQEMYGKLAELQQMYLDGEIASEEEYKARQAEIMEHYYGANGILTTYSHLYNIAVRTDAAATQEYWGKEYGLMTQQTANWKEAVNQYLEDIKIQTDAWKEVSTKANEDVENALTDSEEATKKLTDESEKLKDMLVDELIPAIEDEILEVLKQTEAYAAQRAELLKLIEDYKNYLDMMNTTVAVQNKGFDENIDYSGLMNEYLSKGGTTSDATYQELLKQRNAKIEWLKTQGKDASYWGTSGDETTEMYNALLKGGSYTSAISGKTMDQEWFHSDYVDDAKLPEIFESLGVPIEEIQALLEKMSESGETTNEKLDTSNEKTDTTNEKLDTTNEKLDTSNEKAETANTELKTANTELKTSNTELKTSNTNLETINKSVGEVKTAVEAVETGVEKAGGAVRSAVGEVKDAVSNGLTTQTGAITSAIGTAAGTISGAVAGISGGILGSLAGALAGGFIGKKIAGMDTGGYTGAWGPEGKLAVLHEKELVLNANDTENLLSTIDFVRSVVGTIDARAANASLSSMNASVGVPASNETLEQSVTIHAEFPNATNHSEIEEAFNNLVNRASQYANRK